MDLVLFPGHQVSLRCTPCLCCPLTRLPQMDAKNAFNSTRSQHVSPGCVTDSTPSMSTLQQSHRRSSLVSIRV